MSVCGINTGTVIKGENVRRVLSAVVIAVMIIGLVSAVPISASEDFAFERRNVRVGISQFPHFSEIESDGSYKGIIIDYLAEIKKYAGWNIEYFAAEPEEITDMLDSGKIDLIGGMIKNSTTMRLYNFAELSSGYAYSTLTVNKNHTEYIANDYDSFRGIKVGIYQKAISRIAAFDEFRSANGLDFVPVYFDDTQKWEEAFQKGEVDAQLKSSAKLRDGERIIASFQMEPYYFGLTKGNADVLRELNFALKQIDLFNPNFESDLYKRYFVGSSEEKFNLTAAEKEFVNDHPVLRVTAAPDWQPISFFDDRGQLVGITANLMNIISEKTGIQLTYVQAKSFNDALDLLKTKQVDMVLGVDGNGIKNSGGNLAFSLPYLTIQNVMLRKSKSDSHSDVQNPPVMAVAYGFEYDIVDSCIRQNHDRIEDAISAVKEEKADFTVVNNLTAEHFMINHGKSGLKVVPISNIDTRLSIAFRDPVNPILLTIFDRAINAIDDSQRQAVILQNVTADDDISFARLIYSNPTQAILIILSVAGLVLVLLFLIMYMRLRISRKNSLISDTYRIIGELSDEYIFAYDFESNLLTLPRSFIELTGGKSPVSRDDCAEEGLQKVIDSFNNSAQQPNFSVECNCHLANQGRLMFRAVCTVIFDDIGRPVRGIGKLVNIQSEIDEKRRLEEQLNTDALTGLYSKQHCERLASEAIENNLDIRNGAMLLIDIDNFKAANDTLGHLGGDAVLKHFARTLETVFHSGEVLGRWGGDEFLVFISDARDRKSVEKKAQKLCSNMNEEFRYDDAKFWISVSVGIAFADVGSDFREVFQAADEALYQIKRDQKNGYRFA